MYTYNRYPISVLVVKIIIPVFSELKNVGLLFFGTKDARELLDRLPSQVISDNFSAQVYCKKRSVPGTDTNFDPWNLIQKNLATAPYLREFRL
jgi:hypothetical protein